jgi:hypothetical protein
MKTFTLPLLAAVAIGAITIGSATAMPFSVSHGTAVLDDSLVQDVRVVCNRAGNCWNTGSRYRAARRHQSPGYYGRSGYYAEDRRGYYAEPGYGYYRAPHVGVGIGPFGFGIY